MEKVNRILVTGSAGFIGYHVSKALLGEGFEVLGIDNINDYYSPELKKYRLKDLTKQKKFNFIKEDLINLDKVCKIVDSFKPEVVIHLAAQAGVRYSLKNPKSYLDSNLISFFNILEAIKIKRLKKFIFASSSSVYGNSTSVPYSEESPTDKPISLYAATKKANESLAYAFSLNSGIHTIGLRFFTVYGPKGRPDMAYFKFSDLINSGKEITIFNEGNMSRDMTYISDVVQGILQAIRFENFTKEIPYEIFNLGNDSPVSNWDLINFIEDFFEIKGKYKFQETNTEVKKTWADITKSKKLLNYAPDTKFEEGMKRFLDWYLDFKVTK